MSHLKSSWTFCESLDGFLDAKFGISHETQENISKSVNSMERKLADKSERRCATENNVLARQSSKTLIPFK